MGFFWTPPPPFPLRRKEKTHEPDLGHPFFFFGGGTSFLPPFSGYQILHSFFFFFFAEGIDTIPSFPPRAMAKSLADISANAKAAYLSPFPHYGGEGPFSFPPNEVNLHLELLFVGQATGPFSSFSSAK